MSERQPVSPPASPPATPRWVKVLGIILVVVVVVFVALHLSGNSLGGPASHMPTMQHSERQP